MKQNPVLKQKRNLNAFEEKILRNLSNNILSQSEFRSQNAFLEEGNTGNSPIKLITQSKPNSKNIGGKQWLKASGYESVITLNTETSNVFLGEKRHLVPEIRFHVGDSVYFCSDPKKLTTMFKKDAVPENVQLYLLNYGELTITLLQILNTINRGIKIEVNSQKEIAETFLPAKKGFLLIGETQAIKQLKDQLKLKPETGFYLGSLIEEKTLTIIHNKKQIVGFPLHDLVQDFLKIVPLTLPPNIAGPASFTPYTFKEKKNYSKETISLYKKVESKGGNEVHPKSAESTSGVALTDGSKGEILGLSVNDNGHLVYPDLELQGMVDMANAARKLTCKGIRPTIGSSGIYLDDQNPASILYLSGLKKMSRSLSISIENVSTLSSTVNLRGFITVAGIKHDQTHFNNNSFKSEGDFISILGSHRGELGMSLYLQMQGKDSEGILPGIDLNMESRIQEAVLTGIKGNLLHSATMVSGGGIAIAMAKTLANSEDGLGARIHFSRKLRKDELLFGETQGLVVISIAESDLMEFERICMNIGVPTTTVGRVTDEGKFTFNDLINISVNDIISR